MPGSRAGRDRIGSKFALVLAVELVSLVGAFGAIRDCLAADWVHLSSRSGDLLPPNENGAQQVNSLIFDVDQDGMNDFVVGERTGSPGVVWFRRLEDGWERFVIDSRQTDVTSSAAFYDLDRDGDLDVLMGARSPRTRSGGGRIPTPTSTRRRPGFDIRSRALEEISTTTCSLAISTRTATMSSSSGRSARSMSSSSAISRTILAQHHRGSSLGSSPRVRRTPKGSLPMTSISTVGPTSSQGILVRAPLGLLLRGASHRAVPLSRARRGRAAGGRWPSRGRFSRRARHGAARVVRVGR